MCAEPRTNLQTRGGKAQSLILPQGQRLLTKPKQRQLAGHPTIGIILLLLLFVIAIVNCLILEYKLCQLITDEAENSPRSAHLMAKESKSFLANIDTKHDLVVKANRTFPGRNVKEAKPMIAFLRISKTGSTTLSTFINLNTPLP